jgi:hypothetical protein
VYIIEYSQSQDMFHIHLLSEAIRTNRPRAVKKEPNDWVVVGVADNADDAQDTASDIRQRQSRREP